MGMDVIGRKPKKEVGKYFRRNVWGWHPLWDYCKKIHPDLVEKVKNGHSNDGDGLGMRDSKKLAKALVHDVFVGAAEKYVTGYKAYNNSLPEEPCKFCAGTGKRTDWPEYCTKEHIESCNGCNSCNGTGKVKSFETWYGLEVEDICEFSEFLYNCGGFKIL